MDPADLLPAPGSRIAVIGGCGGIGRALVARATQIGAQVAVVDLERSIAAFPPPAGVSAYACDASVEDDVRDAFARIDAEWGGLDAMVNLVGFTNEPRVVEEMEAADWTEVLTGSLTSAFLLSRAAIPLLRRAGGGAIVHVSSTFGVWVPQPGFAPYATAKAGIITLVRALATECGPDIRVNALAPGMTQTAFLEGGTGRPGRQAKTDPVAIAAMTPLKRIGQPEDMVGPLLFLIGPGSAYITAQTLHVNGGLWS